MRTTFLATFLLCLTSAAIAQTKTITDSQCEMTVPANWVDSKVGGVGAHASDRSMSALLHSFPASDYPAAVDMLKQSNNKVVEDNSSRLVLETATGSRKQIFVMTKTKPVGCRASVMFSQEGAESDAKKIAETVKPK